MIRYTARLEDFITPEEFIRRCGTGIDGHVQKVVDAAVIRECFPYERLYLFKAGDQCTDVTGGWTDDGWTFGSNYYSDVAADIGDTISISITNKDKNRVLYAGTKNKVSLDGIKTLCFEVTSATAAWFSVLSSKATDSPVAGLRRQTGTGIYSIDVSSLTGSYYIALGGITYSSLALSAVDAVRIWGVFS